MAAASHSLFWLAARVRQVRIRIRKHCKALEERLIPLELSVPEVFIGSMISNPLAYTREWGVCQPHRELPSPEDYAVLCLSLSFEAFISTYMLSELVVPK
ncbi:hypothetical protein ACJRO7_007739 [Eucalyptus globulus]|uniref:Uncharacterized protein n=1 Tax=Eucalyptus globulus TaxID=34317 RepID=A0ABD3IM24_EUCGL